MHDVEIDRLAAALRSASTATLLAQLDEHLTKLRFLPGLEGGSPADAAERWPKAVAVSGSALVMIGIVAEVRERAVLVVTAAGREALRDGGG